jgi:hypothetical protein
MPYADESSPCPVQTATESMFPTVVGEVLLNSEVAEKVGEEDMSRLVWPITEVVTAEEKDVKVVDG